jgi:hypothetical protein
MWSFVPFGDACWTYLGIRWNLSVEFHATVLNVRLHFIREAFIISAWSLWCHRNVIIFLWSFPVFFHLEGFLS